MAILNAGESASRKVSASTPPKLRFDVYMDKFKTQNEVLATFLANLKLSAFKSRTTHSRDRCVSYYQPHILALSVFANAIKTKRAKISQHSK